STIAVTFNIFRISCGTSSGYSVGHSDEGNFKNAGPFIHMSSLTSDFTLVAMSAGFNFV
ncbi:unnamed protein product, partial [Allacma fusca]